MKKIVSYLVGAAVLAVMAMPAFAADVENPSDVTGFEGQALNGAVHLSWDEASDDVGVDGYVVYYGENSVSEPGESYDKHKDVGDVLEYDLSGLKNGTTYYFSVIAYDAVGNESIAWATEVALTPSADGEDYVDSTAPQVKDAEAVNEQKIRVEFSESIVLPDEDSELEFLIENDDTFETLEVTAAELDEDDEDNKTVILTTEKQEADASYTLTVGIGVEDESGNPIISGTSDTALFVGSGDAVDSKALELISAESVDETHVLLEFNKTIVLGIDPSDNFQILEEDDPTEELDILEVVLGDSSDDIEDASVVLTTSEQRDVTYAVVVTDVTDENGVEITPSKGTATFDGDGSGSGSDDDDDDYNFDDVEDANNFLVQKIIQEAEKYRVRLGWEVPAGNDGLTDAQKLYISKDGEDFDEQDSLYADDSEYDVEGLEAGDYWFKLTQVGRGGEETEGVTVKVNLAETGPGMAALALFSLGLGKVVSRRKKDQ